MTAAKPEMKSALWRRGARGGGAGWRLKSTLARGDVVAEEEEEEERRVEDGGGERRIGWRVCDGRGVVVVVEVEEDDFESREDFRRTLGLIEVLVRLLSAVSNNLGDGLPDDSAL